ncbi:MAG: DUF3592 domain-containing protein [Pseudomonadota bacterium]
MSDLTNGPAPGFWRMLWKTGGLLPLFLGVFTVIFTLISSGELRDGLAFEARGVTVEGDVVDRDSERVRRDDRWQTKYYLTIRYTVSDEEIEMRRSVRRTVYDNTQVGGVHLVRYLPERPRKVEFEVGQTLASGRLMRWISLGLGLATLGTLWWKGGKAVDAIRARKFGAAETVRVSEIREIRHKNGRTYALHWTDAQGTSASSLARSSCAAFDAYPPGTAIEVFRGVKGRMWWVGDVGPRASAATVPSRDKSGS